MLSRLALAMAASALVVAVLGSTPIGNALTSQVPRNSVGTLQLKRNAVKPSKLAPNSVRTAHVLNGSLLSSDFRPGQLPAGAKGDKGDKGDPGQPGVAQREIVVASSAADSAPVKLASATCPQGKVAVGGGADILGGTPPVSITVNNPSFANPGQWNARAHELTPTNANWVLRAHAVCARVG